MEGMSQDDLQEVVKKVAEETDYADFLEADRFLREVLVGILTNSGLKKNIAHLIARLTSLGAMSVIVYHDNKK